MEFCVKYGPVFSALQVDLDEGEHVVAQPSSMLTMTGGIQISARAGRQAKSSALSGLRSMLGGENFFTAEFRAKRNDQTVTLAPATYGDILKLSLDQENGFYLTRGAYLANVGECNLTTKYGGMKGLMSSKGLFLMHATGNGTVFCQCYGAIVEQCLGKDEYFFVDNKYMIAFSDTITYQLVKATKSVRHTLMSGEGFVNRYTGPGKLYYQTRGKQTGGFISLLLDSIT